MGTCSTILAAVSLTCFLQIPTGSNLMDPFRVLSADGPIDVERGHSAPWFDDFDGDGLPDLLVGQFAGGKLRLYRNVGTATTPEFEGFEYFQVDGADGAVPPS